jgi:hypothetical protein
MFNKINICQIITNHIATLRNENTKRLGFDDFLTFLLIPLIITIALILFKVYLSDSAITIIITTLSILVGLLFNVIVIIFDIIKRDGTKKLKNRILHELLTNISFSIILSIVIIIFTLVTYFTNKYVKLISTGLVYFFLCFYIFTVLMILKRMYVLFINELNEIENNAKSSKS